MTNEIIPYQKAPQKKRSFLGGILGFLLCFEKTNSQPVYQEIQSIHHVLPREEILHQIIDIFITNTERPIPTWRKDPKKKKITWAEFLEAEADSYSEAMTGVPICALVKTPTNSWLVALTRTVKLRWPEFIFETKPKIYERYNLDDYEAFLKKQLQTREYEVLRDTEGWKAIISPFKDKKLDLMSGYLFKWKGNPIMPLQTPLSEKSPIRSAPLFTLDISNLLQNLQIFHTSIEIDNKKRKQYLGSEMYSRPEDYEHLRSHGYMASIKPTEDDFVIKKRYFCDPGLVVKGGEDNFKDLYPLRGTSFKDDKRRIAIPPPKKGARLIYKAEEKFYLPHKKTLELE